MLNTAPTSAGKPNTLLLLFTREEVARMWRKREAEWEREKLARERLMAEVWSLL